MTTHEHPSKSTPEKKPAQDGVTRKEHAIHQKEDHPQGHDMHNSSKAETKMAHAGPDHHAHKAVDFRKRFWISLVLTLPILGLSPLLQKLVGLREAIHFPGDIYVLFGFASAVFWYVGWPCLKGLFKELESRQPGMMTLVAVAITTAYVYSSAVVGLAGALGGVVEDIAKGSSLVAAGQLGRAAEKILPTALAPSWKLASRAVCRSLNHQNCHGR